MKLSVLLSGLSSYSLYYLGEEVSYIPDLDITGICADSRRVKKGEIFVCLNGGNVDSHDFADDAVEKGAIALLSERALDSDCLQIVVKDTRERMSELSSAFYNFPSKRLKVIGITGTNGKTTTSYMLASILRSAGKKVGVIGTLGIYYDKKEIAPELTTPDPIYLQKILCDMLSRNVEYVVMEVSAHALYYKKVSGLTFTACIFTNFTQDHLDFFSSMTEYKKAKLRLFQKDVCPLAIVNADDEVGREIFELRGGEKGKVKTYGLKEPSDSFAVITDEGLKETKFLLNINDRLAHVSLKFTGLHNVYNALSASVCAERLGISMANISDGLNGMSGVKGRLEWVANYNGAEIFVDFAHTPDGLEKSILSLKKYATGRLVCLFGCGGNRDRSKRPIMGEKAGKYADFSVLTSDNPRYEDPSDIIVEIEKGFRRFSSSYVCIPERERAIEYAMRTLKKGDILLVAGKGAEDYQEEMGIKYDYNDEDLIMKIVKRDES